MARHGIITDVSPAELKERVPRLDQRARITLKILDVVCKNGVANLRDLVVPTEQREDEDRMAYVHRRASERQNGLAPTVESYVLARGFGTASTHAMIKDRQAHPDPYEPQNNEWIP